MPGMYSIVVAMLALGSPASPATAGGETLSSCVAMPAIGEPVSLAGMVRLQRVPGPPVRMRPPGLENVPDLAQVLELSEPACFVGEGSEGPVLSVLLYFSTPEVAERVGMATDHHARVQGVRMARREGQQHWGMVVDVRDIATPGSLDVHR